MVHVEDFDKLMTFDNMFHKVSVDKTDGESVSGVIINMNAGFDTEDGYGEVDIADLTNEHAYDIVSEKDFLAADIGDAVPADLF